MESKRNRILILILIALLAPGWVLVRTGRSATRLLLNQHGDLDKDQAFTLTPAASPSPVPPRQVRKRATSTPEMNVLPLIVTGPSPTPEWVWNPPGEVVAPILLYHHIAEKTPPSRYFLPPQVFEQQILSLQRWGYTVIPLSLLATAIQEGAMLPPKPVVITFDDGYKDVFKQAFPILQQYGYVGAVYPIVKQIGTRGYMDGADLKQLAEAGWEIGSHSWTHTSLRSSTVNLEHEIVDSRKEIKDLLGLPVLSFSFPYGLTSKYVTKQVKEANYQFAVGLGISYRHTEKTLYYLSRIEVRSDYDINEFAALLPWSDIHIQPTQTPNDR